MDMDTLFEGSTVIYEIDNVEHTLVLRRNEFMWVMNAIRKGNRFVLIKITPSKDFKSRIEGMIRDGS